MDMSFLSSFLGGGNSAAKYAKKQNGLIDANTALVNDYQSAYDTAARQGAWDPNAQLDQLKADTAYQTRINTGNAAAAARTMGYRPGDTAPLQQMNTMNGQTALQYADAANKIRAGALQAGYAAANNLASAKSGLYNQSIGANAGMMNYAQQQDAQNNAMFGNLLNVAMPFLGSVNLGKGFKMPSKKALSVGSVNGYMYKGAPYYQPVYSPQDNLI